MVPKTGCLGQRFGVEDIEDGCGQWPFVQAANEVRFGHDIAAANVDEDAAFFGFAENVGTQQAGSSRSVGEATDDEVAFRQDVRQMVSGKMSVHDRFYGVFRSPRIA